MLETNKNEIITNNSNISKYKILSWNQKTNEWIFKRNKLIQRTVTILIIKTLRFSYYQARATDQVKSLCSHSIDDLGMNHVLFSGDLLLFHFQSRRASILLNWKLHRESHLQKEASSYPAFITHSLPSCKRSE